MNNPLLTELVLSRCWKLASLFFALSSTLTFSWSSRKQKKNLVNIKPSWPDAWSITHYYMLPSSNAKMRIIPCAQILKISTQRNLTSLNSRLLYTRLFMHLFSCHPTSMIPCPTLNSLWCLEIIAQPQHSSL